MLQVLAFVPFILICTYYGGHSAILIYAIGVVLGRYYWPATVEG